MGIDIRGPIDRPRHQLHRHIAGARPNFEDAIADIRPDHVGHPPRESRRPVQPLENLAAAFVLGVNAIRAA